MQGFDEMSNLDEVICKRMKKDSRFSADDDYENITDQNAYTAMFPVHKASKFGGNFNKQKSSKMNIAKNVIFDESQYIDEEVELSNGTFAELSFQYVYLCNHLAQYFPDQRLNSRETRYLDNTFLLGLKKHF